jgi:O-antigen/teichoic acid export membrane protein
MTLDRLQALSARLFTSRIGQDTLGSMGLKIASTGLVFLSTVLLARSLGPSDYGVYAYVYALVSLLSVPSEFGLPTLVVRETARGIAQKDYALVQGVWHWSGWMTGIISITLVILTGIFILFFKEPLAGIRLETFLWGLALVPLIALGDLRGAALRGLQRVVAGQLPEFLIRPGLFVLLLGGGMWRYPLLWLWHCM